MSQSERPVGPGAPERSEPGLVFDRVLFLRHLAIFAGAVLAYIQQSQLGIGAAAVTIVASSAALNLVCSFLHRRPGWARIAEVGSSVIGVGCWAALAAVTGGVGSPFIAGLWLEIVLAGMLFAPGGIVAVTLVSILGISLIELWHGFQSPATTIALQSGFLAGMGGLTYWIARHALRREEHLVEQRDELDARLRALGDQLVQERTVGRLGGNVARLAHGLKNAVHSLRGFAALIEPSAGGRAEAALAGLRAAIDDLEALARLSLDEAPDDPAAGPQAEAVVRRAVEDVSRSHPKVSWSVDADAADARSALPENALFEVLVILMRNAVEAMGGHGSGSVELASRGAELCIAVRDEGPGIDADQLARIFEPGYTTKAGGSGYGLFLARRIVTEAGGHLEPTSTGPRGTVMELRLPGSH